jgi:hypothetical protein
MDESENPVIPEGSSFIARISGTHFHFRITEIFAELADWRQNEVIQETNELVTV